MKVKCRCCGRQFDYGEYKGQCPKCASYYKMEETQEPEPQNHMTTADVLSGRESGSESLEGASTAVPRKKRSKAYYVVTAVLVLVIILIGTIPIISAYFENQRSYNEMAKASVVEPKELAIGETFTYSAVSYDYSSTGDNTVTYDVAISGVHIDTDSRLMIPEGYEMVVAEYRITDPNEQERATSYDDNSFGTYYNVEIKPYLITSEEQYIEPINERQIQEMKGEERAPFATSDFYQSRGEFYFLVKQGDAKGLWLNCMEEGERTDTLRESYVIRNLEVK